MRGCPIPLIAFKQLSEFIPDEFRQYVRDLRTQYQTEQDAKRELKKLAAAKKSPHPLKHVHYRLNAKGTPVITIRGRKSKWISRNEIIILAKHYGIPQNEMWLLVASKKITVHKTAIEVDLKDIS